MATSRSRFLIAATCFDNFHQHHDALLATQDAGLGAYYLLVADDGLIMGRFNLFALGVGTANLGYRMGEQFAGQGLATEAVQALCHLASSQHNVRLLRAATSHANLASQKVLLKTGFVDTGPADPSELGGKSGTWYQRDLH